jgi:hypothetical protein
VSTPPPSDAIPPRRAQGPFPAPVEEGDTADQDLDSGEEAEQQTARDLGGVP